MRGVEWVDEACVVVGVWYLWHGPNALLSSLRRSALDLIWWASQDDKPPTEEGTVTVRTCRPDCDYLLSYHMLRSMHILGLCPLH